MKVLFLDMDGVLNSQEWFEKNHAARIAFKNTHGMGASDVQFIHPLGHIDPDAVARLNCICDAVDFKIVLSSSWRIIISLDDLRIALTHKGFRHVDRLIDVTPSLPLKSDENRRGMEIKAWLDQHPDVTQYVVLDDDSFDIVKIHPHNFVHTNWKIGLTGLDVVHAISVLNA